MTGQSFLHQFEDDEPDGDECPHPEDRRWEYVGSGRHFDGYRERRVYCHECCTVIERERLPLEGDSDA